MVNHNGQCKKSKQLRHDINFNHADIVGVIASITVLNLSVNDKKTEHALGF